MNNYKRDPYLYREFPFNAVPNRTPFSRSGIKDIDYHFFYLTNSRVWSLLLDKDQLNRTYQGLREHVPMGYNQLWLFNKRFSTKRYPQKQDIDETISQHQFPTDYPQELERVDWPNKLYVVLREPYPYLTRSRDVISFRLEEHRAIEDAKIYTLQKNRRAVVGLMIADLQWH